MCGLFFVIVFLLAPDFLRRVIQRLLKIPKFCELVAIGNPVQKPARYIGIHVPRHVPHLPSCWLCLNPVGVKQLRISVYAVPMVGSAQDIPDSYLITAGSLPASGGDELHGAMRDYGVIYPQCS